jgi:hypothetical protein
MSIAEAIEAPTLNLIPAENIDGVLDLIGPFVRAVAERSRGLIDFEDTIASCKDGSVQLWIIWDGAPMAVWATELHDMASGLKLCVVKFFTGEHSLDWIHLLADLEAWAKSKGCHRVVSYARKGWAKRLPDYRMTHVYLEKDLV